MEKYYILISHILKIHFFRSFFYGFGLVWLNIFDLSNSKSCHTTTAQHTLQEVCYIYFAKRQIFSPYKSKSFAIIHVIRITKTKTTATARTTKKKQQESMNNNGHRAQALSPILNLLHCYCIVQAILVVYSHVYMNTDTNNVKSATKKII